MKFEQDGIRIECTVIPANQDTYAVWKNSENEKEGYWIENVIAYMSEVSIIKDIPMVQLIPICGFCDGSPIEATEEEVEQILFVGTKEECEKKLEELKNKS